MTFLLCAGAALAQQSSSGGAEKAAAAGTKTIAAEVVSTDPVAKTITVLKSDAMDSATARTTLPVDSQALGALKTMTPGQKVKLLCRASTTGKETAVTAIEPVEKPKTNPNP